MAWIRTTATTVLAAAALVWSAPIPAVVAGAAAADKTSDADHAGQKEAFEAAKELGTAPAWNAFLSNYPSGFYADMARAYLKKASEGEAPEAEDEDPSTEKSAAEVEERPCSEFLKIKSASDDVRTKITFVNVSGMYRSISWLDYNGEPVDRGGLNSGEEVTLDTFATHPWMIATGPGDCLQIFVPAASDPATVELKRLPADGPP